MKPILFQEKWYYPTYFDNAHRVWDGKGTGDWSGVLLIKVFTARQFKNRVNLEIKTEVVEFRGANESEMLESLQKQIEGMKELPIEADGNNKFIPEEIKIKLKQYEKKAN